jgi:hypothetical protein
MSRAINDYDFNRAMQLTQAVGDVIAKSAAANMPDVQTAVNGLVQDMTAYAAELLNPPVATAPVADPAPAPAPEPTPAPAPEPEPEPVPEQPAADPTDTTPIQ